MTDQPTPRPAGLDNLLNYVADNLPAEEPATGPKPDHPYGRSVLRVIAVSLDPIPLDSDDDTAHVWVRVPGWTPRRAFLTGARPFAQAAKCEPADLTGRTFFARLNLDAPPTNDDTAGERLEWPELQECPPLPADWLFRHSDEPSAVEASEACGKCKQPFDPADTAFDGRARYHLTPYCRGCVSRCHDTEIADHRCVICA